ncbi:MAG: PAS domain S-box protein, partial [Halococcoides sp.]
TVRALPEDALLVTVHESADSTADDHTRRRLEVALAETETGVWEWELESGVVHWTESMERLFGLEPGTFGGTFEAFSEYVHPDDRPAVAAAIHRAVEHDERFEATYRIRRADGDQRWVRARAERRESPADDVMVGIVTDVTEQRAQQHRLEEREREYRHLVERLPVAYFAVDEDWQISVCNEAFAANHEASTDEIEGLDLWTVCPEFDDTTAERQLRAVSEAGEPDSFEVTAADDRWMNLQAYPYGDGVAVLMTDISAKQRELSSVLDAAPIALYRIDADGVFRELKGDVLTRVGIDREDLLGESIWEVYADNEAVIEGAEHALAGEPYRYTLALGDVTLETQYTPVVSDGEVRGAIGVSMDVSERQRQRERMEFFNSILRHDVLNGMTVITMRGEVLCDRLDGENREHARTIVDWATSTTEVVKRVRRVVETLTTADDEHELAPIEIGAILEQNVEELQRAYPGATLTTDVPDGLLVHADELLADVIGNLLANSFDHNDPDGLHIDIAATRRGDRVQISIADDGIGVEDARKESIFRRGETSAKESGSGFGLFFVDVMVEKYDGEVWVEDNDAGRERGDETTPGARFLIELPAANASDDDLPASTPAGGPEDL